jgi:hypothetical protein
MGSTAMWSRMRAALGVALVVIVVAAGCSDADDDDAGRDQGNDQQTESDGGNADNGGSSDNGGDELIDAGDIEAPEGSDPELRDQYIQAIVDATGTEPDAGFDEGAVQCLATAFVDAAGTDAMSDAVSPEELRDNPDVSPTELGIEFPDDAGDVFYDEFSSCADLRALILASLAQGDAEVQSCLEDAVDDELIKDYTVALFIGGLQQDDPERAELEARLTEAVQPCMPEDTGAGTGTGTTG